MSKKQSAKATMEEIKAKFLEHAADLWDTHAGQILDTVEEAESRKANVTFTACIDLSESVGNLETRLGFSMVFRDKRNAELDNPDQPNLFQSAREGDIELTTEVDNDDDEKGKRRRKKKPTPA